MTSRKNIFGEEKDLYITHKPPTLIKNILRIK